MAVRCCECPHEAIERCEVSGVPLCARHLWYAADGRRVSQQVAQRLAADGVSVTGPGPYLQALGTTAQPPGLASSAGSAPVSGNKGYDTLATVTLIMGIFTLATCFGLGMFFIVAPVPIITVVLGALTVGNARKATDPARARNYGWLAIISSLGIAVVAPVAVLVTIATGLGSSLGPLFGTP